MKIATWNVNSIRSRLKIVKNWLQTNDVDILCLQETKVIDQDFPQQPFLDIGYHVYIYGQKAYNGVAIFSKNPFDIINYGFTDILGAEKVNNLDEQKRVISGVINNLRIVNLYVPNGNAINSEKYHYKLRWLELLKEYLNSLNIENQQLLVCGDFNIALEDKDIYKPEGKANHIMATKAEREALTSALPPSLKDIFRSQQAEGGYYTWWDYRQGGFSKNRGWRIDHIYGNNGLLSAVKKCYIDIEPRKLEKPSDHAPVMVEL